MKLVTNAGHHPFKHKLLFIANALKQNYSGLEEVDDGIWSTFFRLVLLGRIDERTMRICLRRVAIRIETASACGSQRCLFSDPLMRAEVVYREVWNIKITPLRYNNFAATRAENPAA